jgi:hypothetical protein
MKKIFDFCFFPTKFSDILGSDSMNTQAPKVVIFLQKEKFS